MVLGGLCFGLCFETLCGPSVASLPLKLCLMMGLTEPAAWHFANTLLWVQQGASITQDLLGHRRDCRAGNGSVPTRFWITTAPYTSRG